MNKGLAIHLVSIVIYVLSIMYITKNEELDLHDTIGIIGILCVIQYVLYDILNEKNYYNKKL
jgi:hypothetical protein